MRVVSRCKAAHPDTYLTAIAVFATGIRAIPTWHLFPLSGQPYFLAVSALAIFALAFITPSSPPTLSTSFASSIFRPFSFKGSSMKV